MLEITQYTLTTLTNTLLRLLTTGGIAMRFSGSIALVETSARH